MEIHPALEPYQISFHSLRPDFLQRYCFFIQISQHRHPPIANYIDISSLTSATFRTCSKYHYYYYFGVRCARPGESEETLSVQRPQPHTSNPWKEEKDKTVGDKKERADHANRKALALLLKLASPTSSNTDSLRSFQRDTERGTKTLRY